MSCLNISREMTGAMAAADGRNAAGAGRAMIDVERRRFGGRRRLAGRGKLYVYF